MTMMQADEQSYQFGAYTTTKLLGGAGGNNVYVAVHQETQETVALRALNIRNENIKVNLEECREILVELKYIKAPHVVPILDYGFAVDVLYLTTPYLEGESLQKRLAYHHDNPDVLQSPSLGEVAEFITQLAIGLQGLHDKGIIHAQLEAHNILFDDEGQAYISDTGLPRLLKKIFRMDTTGSFTISAYTAPEQWEGLALSPATDLYSLACLAYELTTGKPPFQTNSIYELMKAHMNQVVRAPHHVDTSLPSDLAIPFWQALAKPAEHRHKTVVDFAEAYARAIRGKEGVPAGFFTQPLSFDEV